MLTERIFATCDEARLTVAEDIAVALAAALQEREKVSLVLSGGTTPPGVYLKLATADINWSRVVIGLTDERWVPDDHPDSNEGMVREFLLTGEAAKAEFIGLFNGMPSAAEGQPEAERRVKAGLPRPYDVVFLGMGADGHIASLFPNHPCLKAGGLVTASNVTYHWHWRLSLTAQALLNSRSIFLLACGEDKAMAYVKAKQDPDDVTAMPVRLVLRQDKVPVSVYLSERAAIPLVSMPEEGEA